MTKHGTKDRDPAVKARAEPFFRLREEQKREGQSATEEYLAREDAKRANMAKLRELRLAPEAKAANEKAKSKPAGTGKAKR